MNTKIIDIPAETVNAGPYEDFGSMYSMNFDIDANWPFLPEFFALVRSFMEDREYSWSDMQDPEVMGWFEAWVDLQSSLEFIDFPLVKDNEETESETVSYDLDNESVVVRRISKTRTEKLYF